MSNIRPLTARIVHATHNEFDVYIGRQDGGEKTIRNTPPGECFGNPYSLDDHSRGTSIRKFATLLGRLLEEKPIYRLHIRDLAGRRLGCFCRGEDESEPACHGDVLASHAKRLWADIGSIADACRQNAHHFSNYRGGTWCVECGLSAQAIGDWLGHDVSAQEGAL